MPTCPASATNSNLSTLTLVQIVATNWSRTLRGCKKLRAVATTRKRPLRRAELCSLRDQYMSSTDHDDLLFFVLLLVGFHALMRLGELVWPDRKALWDYWKVTKRNSVELLPEGFSFFLPGQGRQVL